MSFQAYLDTIKAKKGKTPKDFMKLAEAKSFLVEGRQKKSLRKGGTSKTLFRKGCYFYFLRSKNL